MMVDEIFNEDDSRGTFNSLVGFIRQGCMHIGEYNRVPLGAVGIEKTKDDLDSLGKKIFDEMHRSKTREGFDLSKVRVPKRFDETVSILGKVDPQTVEMRCCGFTGR